MAALRAREAPSPSSIGTVSNASLVFPLIVYTNTALLNSVSEGIVGGIVFSYFSFFFQRSRGTFRAILLSDVASLQFPWRCIYDARSCNSRRDRKIERLSVKRWTVSAKWNFPSQRIVSPSWYSSAKLVSSRVSRSRFFFISFLAFQNRLTFARSGRKRPDVLVTYYSSIDEAVVIYSIGPYCVFSVVLHCTFKFLKFVNVEPSYNDIMLYESCEENLKSGRN